MQNPHTCPHWGHRYSTLKTQSTHTVAGSWAWLLSSPWGGDKVAQLEDDQKNLHRCTGKMAQNYEWKLVQDTKGIWTGLHKDWHARAHVNDQR